MRQLILLLMLLPGCVKVCEPKQLRCVGLKEELTGADVVQICTSRGRWQVFADCRKIMIGGKVVAGCCTPAGRCVVRP